MKTIASIIFIIFIGITAQAQDKSMDIKVAPITTIKTTKTTKGVHAKDSTKIVRLYKTKNAKVKRALNFITKANKAKMA
ncbi:hypothetical protein [Maribacter sp. LLG6340-A2]|uniref:hypothetical protein n=1 Tax=Maribacter sp. LLG6340-A2 TaxID=3160834 RepID=UPI00386F7FA3